MSAPDSTPMWLSVVRGEVEGLKNEALLPGVRADTKFRRVSRA